MEIRVYNTLTRKLETFVPLEAGKARVYCCGPTVYDVPHAGHARSAVAFDVLVRALRGFGYEVTYVRNITDIDDKILNRARERGEEPLHLSSRMTDVYRQDMDAIGCLRPTHEPKVSESLDSIFDMVRRLIDRGTAYVVDKDGGKRDVYFAVRQFPGYGKLSRRKLDDLVSGARVEADESKRDPLDFALWKGAAPDEWAWPSPWGHGRPGWHIECAAMSTTFLGHGFDIHGGGMDLIFPHHENEIAESEAASPDAGDFARYWMHNGFVNVDKEKMSKSLGNFVTVRDVLARNDAEAFRWFLLGVQYRGPVQFDTETVDGRVVFPGVDEAEKRVDYLYGTLQRLQALTVEDAPPAKFPAEVAALKKAVAAATKASEAALADDLNTPVALAEFGEIFRLANELADAVQKRRKDRGFLAAAAAAARDIEKAIDRIRSLLGVLQAPLEEYTKRTRMQRLRVRGLDDTAIDDKVAERVQARRDKDFARSDAIRDELAALGVRLRDAPDGTTTWTVEA